MSTFIFLFWLIFNTINNSIWGIYKILGGDPRLPARFNLQDTATTLLYKDAVILYSFSRLALYWNPIYMAGHEGLEPSNQH